LVTLFCALWLGLSVRSPGQAILEPPYGLKWGDSPEKLIAWASRHSLNITISLPGDQPSLRIVGIKPRSGLLPGARESAVEGRFLNGRLFEFTVHYHDPEASNDLVEERFQKLKKQLASEYGALAADQQQRLVEDQFATKTQSFHREPVKGLFLMLAFTEVEDLLRKSKDARFSLIYRNDNLRTEIERMLASPPAGGSR
jgi:hypothetical protein